MQNLIEHYQIQKSFLSRYFQCNAEMRLVAAMRDYMLWRRGNFIFPRDRKKLLQDFAKEEIYNFYEKKELNLPQMQFAITNRCTLKCKECNFFVPYFDKQATNQDLTFDEFRNDFSNLTKVVTRIHRFTLIGGEPLVNKYLPEIINEICSNKNIPVIEIITNGTVIPSAQLLDVAKEYCNKVWFHISDYSSNALLHPVLRHSEIISALKKHNIKHQISSNSWHHEMPMQLYNHTPEELNSMFAQCWVKKCVQSYNGKVSACPRASAGYATGVIPDDDSIDLRHCTEKELLQKFVDFYHYDYIAACRYCTLTNEEIMPALQV